MTTNQKIGLGIGVAAIVVLLIVYGGRIWNWITGASAERTIVNIPQAPQTQTIIQPVYVPVTPNPKPHKPTCDELAKNIYWVKYKITQTQNPIEKAKLEQQLAGLNAKYAQMGCMGGPPPQDPNPQI